jgi:hypothetical protein
MSFRFHGLINYVKRNWLVSTFVIVFAITAATLLIISFAQEPSKYPYETISSRLDQGDLLAVQPSPINSSTAGYTQIDAHKFNMQYPKQWHLYKLGSSGPDASKDVVYLRLLSPDAKLGGESHSSEIELTNGAMVEVSAFTNSQYKDVNDYINQLGDIAVNIKPTNVGGKPAVQYQLSSEDQAGAPLKTIVTFFDHGVQYTISYTVASNSAHNTYQNDFQQIINNFSVK